MKKYFKIVSYIILALIVLYLGFRYMNISNYRRNQIKISEESSLIDYKDTAFGYEFQYPKSWVRQNPYSLKGYVLLKPNDNGNASIEFWYKDSKKITSYDDLLAFVKDDADYANTQQGIKTDSIEKGKLGNLEAVVYNSTDKNGKKATTYYVTTQYATNDQLIYVWIANVIISDIYKTDVESILNSYTLLP